MTGPVSDVTTEMVRHALDVSNLRHLVISNNIANANTPGFVPVELSFDGQLQTEILNYSARSGGDLMGRESSAFTGANQGIENSETSRVNLDWEVAKLSQNVVHYQSLLRGLNGKMAILAMAISEGRR